jgi:hypothetical protein
MYIYISILIFIHFFIYKILHTHTQYLKASSRLMDSIRGRIRVGEKMDARLFISMEFKSDIAATSDRNLWCIMRMMFSHI